MSQIMDSENVVVFYNTSFFYFSLSIVRDLDCPNCDICAGRKNSYPTKLVWITCGIFF